MAARDRKPKEADRRASVGDAMGLPPGNPKEVKLQEDCAVTDAALAAAMHLDND